MYSRGSFPFGYFRSHLLKLCANFWRQTYNRPPKWQTLALFLFSKSATNIAVERDLLVFLKFSETVFLPQLKVVQSVSEKQIQAFARCAPMPRISWHISQELFSLVIKKLRILGRVLFA